MNKICTKCHESKYPQEFRTYKKYDKHYLLGYCRKCENIYSKAYRENNPIKVKEYNSSYRKINKSKISEYNKNYDITHSNRILYLKEYSKEYRKTERGKKLRLIAQQNRRALEFGRLERILFDEWEKLKSLYKNICLCCGASNVLLTMDHVVPLSKGGSNTIDNIQPLCQSCNSKKRAKIIDYRISYVEVE